MLHMGSCRIASGTYGLLALLTVLSCSDDAVTSGQRADAMVLSDSGTKSRVDPRGSDATFNFSWLINGQDPKSTEDPCTLANVQYIRMVVVDPDNPSIHADSFQFDCRLGSYHSSQPEL